MSTRVPIEILFDYLGRNHTLAYFLENFPAVSREQAILLLSESFSRVIAASPKARREAVAR
jgi:hypothetical protein